MLAQGVVGYLTTRRIGVTIAGEREASVAEAVADLFERYVREQAAAGSPGMP